MKTRAKNLLNKFKSINHRHYVAVGLVFLSVLLAIFKYDLSYVRLFQNFKDLWFSLVYYFSKTFAGIDDMTVTVINIPTIDLASVLPFDLETFLAKWELYVQYLSSAKNFSNYSMFVLTFLTSFATLLAILIPIFIIVAELIKREYLVHTPEEDKHKDTDQLAKFKRYVEPVIIVVFDWIKSFIEFMQEHNKYIKLLLFIWLMNLNIVSIVVGVLAYYFYIMSSFDFASLPNVTLKLVVDLVVMFCSASLIFWLLLLYVVITSILKNKAYAKLLHNEMKNRGFINAQPLVTMSCGTMGSKKTTSATDMTLSTSVMFKDKALELLIAHDMKFPNFPWLRFEEDLRRCYQRHINRQELIKENKPCGIRREETIYNLASSKYWVASKAEAWEKDPTIENLWGYDFNKYPLTYDDDLVIYHLFDILIEYSQLYMIYVLECSYIFGNMSVREDMYCDDGYLPMWNTDFFRRTPAESALTSRFAKIFDYDMFRLGKKMIEDNKNSGAFEFGVVILTEIGKERKNNLENRENKKNSNECNQNNDLFNSTLKMIRHRATVCFYPFVRIITDEQRPESWGSDARDLCSVLELGVSSDLIVLYKGLFFDGFIHDIIYPKFKAFYTEMRNLRGDNTLFVYLCKNILAFFKNRYDKFQNRFGYYELPVTVSHGEDDKKVHTYYLSTKKTYSGRFATDTHADFFVGMALESGIGLFDFVPYRNIRQTEDEMALQNSYFYLDMTRWTTKF